MPSCPDCRPNRDAGQKFCRSCGAALTAPTKRRCVHCNAECAPEQKFCVVCGCALAQSMYSEGSVAEAIAPDARTSKPASAPLPKPIASPSFTPSPQPAIAALSVARANARRWGGVIFAMVLLGVAAFCLYAAYTIFEIEAPFDFSDSDVVLGWAMAVLGIGGLAGAVAVLRSRSVRP